MYAEGLAIFCYGLTVDTSEIFYADKLTKNKDKLVHNNILVSWNLLETQLKAVIVSYPIYRAKHAGVNEKCKKIFIHFFGQFGNSLRIQWQTQTPRSPYPVYR